MVASVAPATRHTAAPATSHPIARRGAAGVDEDAGASTAASFKTKRAVEMSPTRRRRSFTSERSMSNRIGARQIGRKRAPVGVSLED